MRKRKVDINISEVVQAMKESSKPKDVEKARRAALSAAFKEDK
jgi:hypothetical protein